MNSLDDIVIGLQSATLLFFFVQGMIFSVLLWRNGRGEGNRGSCWLALFTFLCCLYITPFMCGYSGWYAHDGYREFLFYVPFQQLFLLGPVIYCYVRSLLYPTAPWRNGLYWHFLPGVLYLVYSLIMFVADHWALSEPYFYADGRDRDLDEWYQITGFMSLIVYVVLSIRMYNRYRRRIFAELSFAAGVVYGWVREFLIALLLILVLRFIFLVLFPNFGSFSQKWWYYLIFSLLFYYVTLAGYTKAVKTSMRLQFETLPEEAPEPGSETSEPTAELEEWKSRIEILMQDREFYRNPTLTLADVATALETTTKQISTVINRGFGINFNDFVNGYRVEAVRTAFATGAHDRLTILGVALDCGFNSKTTFNRVFKQHVGQTPGEYVKKLS